MRTDFLFCLWLLITVNQPVAAIQAQPDDSKMRAIRYHLDSLATADHFSGVVLIATNGKSIFEKSYGYANLADSIRNTLHTRFNLASMNKMFTGLSVIQLAASGKIALHESVGHYLPDYPNKTVRDSVTIQQLLTHTSGMGNFWQAHDSLAKEKFRSVDDYMRLYSHDALLFKPGSKFSYSNSGYMVLGAIIEKVSGEDYFTYVRNHIFTPAGMSDTESFELDYAIPRLATGYTMTVEKPGQWRNNNWSNVIKGTPAGGGYSTASDLLKFAIALENFSLLNPHDTKEFLTGRVNYSKGKYGYGVSEDKINGHVVVGHTGGHYGIANEVILCHELNTVIVILTNGEVENYWEAANYIKLKLFGATPAINNYFYTRSVCNLVLKNGYEAGLKHVQKHTDYAIRERVVERIAFKTLFENKPEKAVELLKMNITIFPDSPLAYLNLADVYALTGDLKSARTYYLKYLKLEPTDAVVQDKIRSMTNNKSSTENR